MHRIEHRRRRRARRRNARRAARHALGANHRTRRATPRTASNSSTPTAATCATTIRAKAPAAARPAQNPGPNLAPGPIPYAAFVKQLRTAARRRCRPTMRTCSAIKISPTSTRISRRSRRKDPHSIALLNGEHRHRERRRTARSSSRQIARRVTARPGGGVGPSLKNESARKDTGAVAFVKNPPAAMPKLYPGLLSESDVAAVAATWSHSTRNGALP